MPWATPRPIAPFPGNIPCALSTSRRPLLVLVLVLDLNFKKGIEDEDEDEDEKKISSAQRTDSGSIG